MKHHALVIDDDPAILDQVKDRLDSLGHTCDCVTCQEEARARIQKNAYSFILLDLEIPTKYGKPTRRQNGQNLLKEIRGTAGYEQTQIIVITAHGHDSPDLATEVLRGNGANDFIKKPFPDTGHTLEKAVRDALKRHSTSPRTVPVAAVKAGASKPVKHSKPQPFTSGDLVFYPNKVKLCGVKILGDSGLGHSRKMLDMLRERRRGRFARIGGEELAKKIGEAVNGAILIGTITGCANTIRRNIKARLKRDLNLVCEDQDVLVRDEQGYHLNDDKIRVQDGIDDEDGSETPVEGTGEEAGSTAVSADESEDTDDLNDRQKWVLAQTGKGQDVTRARLEEVHDVSTKTAKRDLSDLVKRGLIEYVRKPHPGFYREKK
jgi:DNA-binding response OmpR family regulator